MTEDGKLRDAAVLGLDGTKALELGLIGILQEAERIPETQGGCETDTIIRLRSFIFKKFIRHGEEWYSRWAPMASSKLMRRAEVEATRAAGAKAEADTRDARMATKVNMVEERAEMLGL